MKIKFAEEKYKITVQFVSEKISDNSSCFDTLCIISIVNSEGNLKIFTGTSGESYSNLESRIMIAFGLAEAKFKEWKYNQEQKWQDEISKKQWLQEELLEFHKEEDEETLAKKEKKKNKEKPANKKKKKEGKKSKCKEKKAAKKDKEKLLSKKECIGAKCSCIQKNSLLSKIAA